EKTPFKSILGVGISLMGVVLIGLNGSAGGGAPLSTVVMMLSSSLSYGCFLMVGRHVTKRISVFPLMFFVFGIALTVCTIFSLVAGHSLALPAAAIKWVVLIALVCTVASQCLSSWSLRSVAPTTISVTQLFSPVLSALSAFIFVGEKVGISVVLGGAVVLCGLFVYLMGRGKKEVVADMEDILEGAEELVEEIGAAKPAAGGE
ncbi:DMT family transporter, partial [Eubacteriales bacterium OttesenSCG-928-M02]|nr:DMT family transporter [Eubacteriales bacterium OttesenSCG-928-M02]